MAPHSESSRGLLLLAATLAAGAADTSADITVPSRAWRRGSLHSAERSFFRPLAELASPASARSLLSSRSSNPYCMPSDACWPSASAWAALNSTLRGALLAPQPEAYACATWGVSDPTCQSILSTWSDPNWRASVPAAMQNAFFESNITSGDGCFNFSSPCHQGDVSPVAVNATSRDQVAAALAFAVSANVRVVVKSTGHEFQGRSAAGGSLLVWMHHMKSIQVVREYVACAGDAPRPAAIIAAGSNYGEAYAALLPEYELVGGSARTVSAAGGHALGGGHSYMSPAHGLTVDNILSYDAVLANGSMVTASACENPDLFWALRGGGGGTFAVVTSATHALHPVQPAGVVGMSTAILLMQGLQSVAIWLDGFLSYTPTMLNSSAYNGVWGGYFNVFPVSSTMYAFSCSFVFNGSMGDAAASMSSLQAFVRTYPNDLQFINPVNLTAYPTFSAWHDDIDPPATGDRTGTSETLGSTLIPMAYASDASLRGVAVMAMVNVTQYVPLLGHLVVGGAVAAADPTGTQTSVTPAWRTAAWHVVFGVGWQLNATIETIAPLFVAATELTSILRAAMPESGAYFSESDYLEPAWQTRFWGDVNYARLQSIKQAYDPSCVFSCHHCVSVASCGSVPEVKGKV